VYELDDDWLPSAAATWAIRRPWKPPPKRLQTRPNRKPNLCVREVQMKTMRWITVVLLWLCVPGLLPAQQAGKKRVLAIGLPWAGSTSLFRCSRHHLPAGRDTASGDLDTYDTRTITKKDLLLNAKNLKYFDACFS